jgi:hypothetical protein
MVHSPYIIISFLDGKFDCEPIHVCVARLLTVGAFASHGFFLILHAVLKFLLMLWYVSAHQMGLVSILFLCTEQALWLVA